MIRGAASRLPAGNPFPGFRLPPAMPLLKPILLTIAGAVAGFSYHHFIGCRSGACPIWANPWMSTGYGALLGMMLGAGGR